MCNLLCAQGWNLSGLHALSDQDPSFKVPRASDLHKVKP